MNKLNFGLWLLSFLFLVSFGNRVNAVANTWNYVGTSDSRTSPSIRFDPSNNDLYKSSFSSSFDYIGVSKFENSSWTNLVSPNIQSTNADSDIEFNPLTNELYVSSVDFSDINIRKFDGSSWADVGSLTEKCWNGVLSSACNKMLSFVFKPGTEEIYISFPDSNDSEDRIRVMKFDGSSWSDVGGGFISSDSGNYSDIAFHPTTNELYVAYQQYSSPGTGLYVKKFDGSSWSMVGGGEIYSGETYFVKLAFNPGNLQPYVVFSDNVFSGNGIAMRYDGSSWLSVGSSFSSDIRTSLSLTFNPLNNEPYVALTESGDLNIKRYNGSSWVNFSSSGLPENGEVPKIIFNPITTEPFISFTDLALSVGAVMKFNSNTAEINSPSPSGGIYDSSQSVTLSTITDGASIYYTTDGSMPTTLSDKYLTPLTISSSMTLRVIASKDGMASSEVVNQDYEINLTTEVSRLWENVGTGDISIGEADYNSIAFNPVTSEPYVAYKDGENGDKVTVVRFNGVSWVPVGTVGFSPDTGGHISLAFNPSTNEPYVAFTDGPTSKLSVMKFNGSSWANVGNVGFSSGFAYEMSLAFNPSTNEPYVAFKNGGSIIGEATVMKFNGSSWVNIGEADFSEGFISTISLVFNLSTNEPYVAFNEGIDSFKSTVMKFNGSSWVNVGDPGFSAGQTSDISISLHPSTNEPYVAFRDQTVTGEATVMKFNGSSWVHVGNAGFSPGIANYTFITFNPITEEPFVVFNDALTTATAMKFNGEDWVYVGNRGFSAEDALYEISIAFDPSTNETYVAYRNGSSPGKGYVMSFMDYVETPSASSSSGEYSSVQLITLSTTTSDAIIYYTIDGSTPTTESVLYSEEITISENTTLKAVAIKDGLTDSEVMTEDYIINLSSPVYRFWSDQKQGHFFTASEVEKDSIIATYPEDVWKYEGVAYNSYTTSGTGITPIYRFWSNQKQHHFYTASETEKDYIIANYDSDVWNYERIAYYAYSSSQAGTIPVFRFWSDTKQGHFYTSSESERDYIIATYDDNVWSYEGIAWYVPEE